MEEEKSLRKALFEEILEKGRRFCAFRERSSRETKTRLQQTGAAKEDLEKVVLQLQKEDFLNDARFAAAFVRGKFNQNHWGREKIARGLAEHGISEETIREAMQEIAHDNYISILDSIVKKKLESLKGQPEYIARGKTVEFCQRKGFEVSLIQQRFDELFNRNTP